MERLVLVHGSVSNGERTWRAQRALGDRYELVVLNRPGFPPGPPVDRVDFEADARWLGALLRPGDHLAAHSYGGLVALLAAAGGWALASLTVVEPPAFAVARGHPAVEEFVRVASAHWRESPPEPEAFLRGFLRAVGSPLEPRAPLPPELEQGARLLMVERPPWEAEVPLRELAAAPFPKLVVSGGHSVAFDEVCGVLEGELCAERAVCPGAGHSAQAAPGFNDVLARFLEGASARRG